MSPSNEEIYTKALLKQFQMGITQAISELQILDTMIQDEELDMMNPGAPKNDCLTDFQKAFMLKIMFDVLHQNGALDAFMGSIPDTLNAESDKE